MSLHFDNSYARDLVGAYVLAQADPAQGQLVFLNQPLAQHLGVAEVEPSTLAQWFSGQHLPSGAEPLAQVYAGHQFGRFVPQLGDGRALLLGEVLDHQQQRWDIALKGSGPTVFSRGGDGYAALGPMLREVLISESLHSLGIPTTRALAVVTTGRTVRRQRPLPGAILTRVAASHLRVGSCEYFFARQQWPLLERLVRYAIARHDPQLVEVAEPWRPWLEQVAERQSRLVAMWLNVGFVHGVMNTDNMALSGQSLDFGPCAFLEHYSPSAVFSSIDHHGRYAFGQQGKVMQWNLARLADCLVPLSAQAPEQASEQLYEVVVQSGLSLERHLLAGQRLKLGLLQQQPQDETLIAQWLALLERSQVDVTLAWWHLNQAAKGEDDGLLEHFGAHVEPLRAWLLLWRQRLSADDAAHVGGPQQAQQQRYQHQRQANPRLIARNRQVEQALEQAEAGDFSGFEQLLEAVRQPFSLAPNLAAYAQPAPAEFTAAYQTFCGT